MSILTYTYQFSGSTVEPPTGSQLRFDADIATGTQKIWVRYLTADGVDAFFALMATGADWILWVQDKDDHTKYAQFTMTGPPVDKGGYVELPVQWNEDGAPLTSQQVVLGIVSINNAEIGPPGPAGPPGPSGVGAPAVLDDFNRADENPLSDGGRWATSPLTFDAPLQLRDHQAAHTHSQAGSFWQTPFAGDFEVFYTVAVLPPAGLSFGLSLSPDQGPSGYIAVVFLDAATDGSQPPYVIFVLPDSSRPSALIPGGTFMAGDALGMRRVGTHVSVRVRVAGVWQTVMDVDDATFQGPLYVAPWIAASGAMPSDVPTRFDTFTGGVLSAAVPNVVGLTEAAATSLLASANLAVGARTTAPGPVPPGAVAYQAPAAGLFVAPQTPIAITVASGPPPAPTVPPTSATPGDPLANSYETVEEFKTYCASRAHTTLPPDDQIAALLIQGTNLLDNTLAGPPDLELAQVMGQLVAYAWTQQPATDEQALAWPRVNEKNRNGSPIPPTVIPQGVKDCVSEIVLGLQSKDLTATNDTAVQGISSVKASSVAVSFKDTPASSLPPDQRVRLTVLPDAAWLCLVPSWYQWPVQAGLEAQGKGSAGFDFAVT